MFPTHYGAPDLTDESVDYYVGHTLESTLRVLSEQIRRALPFLPEYADTPASALEERAFEIARDLGQQLPAIRALLVSDIQAAYAGDPAAQHITEILLCYPGVLAMMHHLLAHALHRLGVTLLARFINEIAHSATGIDIHPGAQIGDHFFIDHGTGIVVGETTIIGDRVKLYQGVTLGALSTRDGHHSQPGKRHPTVEDDVTIYSGATILGGNTTIGRGSVVGGNAFLTSSVQKDTRVVIHAPETVFKSRKGEQ